MLFNGSSSSFCLFVCLFIYYFFSVTQISDNTSQTALDFRYYSRLSFVNVNLLYIRHDTRLNDIIIGILRAELCYVDSQTSVINANLQMIIY